MDTRTLIATIAGFAVVAFIIVFLIGTLVSVGERNRKKGIEMHETCVEAGFSGWNSYYGCIGGSGDND